MASLSDGRQRAQMLIIGAIALAMLLVVVALALNTAVVGEIHVAQTDTSLQEERAALQYHATVERGVSGIVVRTQSTNTTYDALSDEFEAEVETWHKAAAPAYTRDGAITDLEVDEVTFGSSIKQEQAGPFTDPNGNEDWLLTDEAAAIRTFSINLTDEDLASPDECVGEDECFTITVSGSEGEDWYLYVRDDAGPRVTVESPAGSESCQVEDPSRTLDVRTGTLADGTQCFEADKTIGETLQSPYRVSYGHAANVSGTYAFEIDGQVEESLLGEPAPPNVTAEIRTATLELRYRSSTVTYATQTTVSEREENA